MSQSQGPMQALQAMSGQNEQAGQVMQAIQQNGNGDPQTAFYNLAQQRGADPNAVLSQARDLARQLGYKV